VSRLLRDGQRIGRSYEVERYLGEGAYAQVYRVRHRFLGRMAMKVLTTAEAGPLLAEARVLARLHHPNVVRVFDVDTLDAADGEHAFLTTEYVGGGTLHEFRTGHRDGLVPVATAVAVLRQVCAGLAAAHGQDPPVVHRDLTPLNILVETGPRVRVADFGLAVRADPGTGRTSAAGTIAYKAPEVRHDERADSPAADVWAVGAIAHELLTGVLPDRPPRSPAELNPEVDDALAAVVLAALHPDPTRRIPDAAALHTALADWPRPAADPLARAHRLAAEPGGLPAAADLLEQAIRDDPALAERYGHRVALWRRGVVA
jgi:serine/threonine-protein kinase